MWTPYNRKKIKESGYNMRRLEFENNVNARINDLYSITGKEISNIKTDIKRLENRIRDLEI